MTRVRARRPSRRRSTWTSCPPSWKTEHRRRAAMSRRSLTTGGASARGCCSGKYSNRLMLTPPSTCLVLRVPPPPTEHAGISGVNSGRCASSQGGAANASSFSRLSSERLFYGAAVLIEALPPHAGSVWSGGRAPALPRPHKSARAEGGHPQ